MKKSQKGSTSVVLLVIILVILLGVIGWIYFKQPNQINQIPDASSDVANQKTNSVPTNSVPTINNDQSAESIKNQLNNAQISFESAGKSSNKITVNLNAGKYDYQSLACSPSPCSFELNINQAQIKDINGDGKLDALVTSSNWTGGNKSLHSVEVFLNNNGILKYVGAIPFGTSPTYNSLQAENGTITINYNVTYNGAAGWSDPKTFTYRIEDNQLIQTQAE